jgi:hypothetical protein
MRFLIMLLAIVLCAHSWAGDSTKVSDTVSTAGDSCVYLTDSTGKVIARSCKNRIIFRSSQQYPAFSFGVGISALSFNAKTGNIGILSSIDIATVTFNGFQRLYAANSEAHKMALWCPSAGLSVTKDDSSSVEIGIDLVPWSIKFDSYQFGIGVRYATKDRLDISRSHFNVIIPITYSF